MDKKELVIALKDMSDGEIIALIRDARKEEKVKHTGYEKSREYFYIGVNGDIRSISQDNCGLYDCANYYSDINVARGCTRADTLMRKLRRFAAEHGGCIGPNGPNAWCITYDYGDESLGVKEHRYCDLYIPGMILFESEQAAKDAINEFADELDWYFNYYEPMPADFNYWRNK